MDIEWIFFDIGSTLIDEEPAYRARIRRNAELAAKNGVTIDENAFFEEMKKAALEYLPPYVTVCDKMGLLRLKYMCELDEPYSDAVSVLETLSRRYKLGIIANQPLGSEERLTKWGLRRFISVGCYSAELGVSKPSEGIFRDALYKAACKPENAVMVGDRLENDIYPAKKIGMKTVRILQGFNAMQVPRNSDYESDYTINRLTELLDIF